MSEDKLHSIIESYLIRIERGEQVDERQWLDQHPELAEELASFFALHRRACAELCLQDPGSLATSATEGALNPKLMDSGTLTWAFADVGKRPGARRSESLWSWNRVDDAQFPLPFGPYDLIEEIKRGGMGIVYKAIHRDLRRVVALKVVRSGELATDEELFRFRTEAVASSALSHPNIVPIFEAGEEHGLVYFTMPFIDGEDLESRVRSAPVDPQCAAKILLKVTEAVAYAHQKSIIHRDIKPSNVLLDRGGEPYLVDFGLARLRAAEDGMTVTGQLLGTPAYMAPEQASGHGQKLSEAVDVYALGAVLYTMLTRQPPYSGPTPFDILLQLIDREPPLPSQVNRQVPRVLESICLTAMAKDPRDRYPSADALAADLRCYLRGEPIVMHRPTLGQRLEMWWRREPVLVSHLVALVAVGLIMWASFLVRYPSVPEAIFATKFGLVVAWFAASICLQRLARANHSMRDWIYLAWATTDVVIYTSLIYLASPPRGLLLVGYPMMIAATGLFYRVRFVIFTTAICCCGMLLLSNLVRDPIAERADFLGIYITGLVVLGSCVVTMIRRVRGLSRFYGESE